MLFLTGLVMLGRGKAALCIYGDKGNICVFLHDISACAGSCTLYTLSKTSRAWLCWVDSNTPRGGSSFVYVLGARGVNKRVQGGYDV